MPDDVERLCAWVMDYCPSPDVVAVAEALLRAWEALDSNRCDDPGAHAAVLAIVRERARLL